MRNKLPGSTGCFGKRLVLAAHDAAIENRLLASLIEHGHLQANWIRSTAAGVRAFALTSADIQPALAAGADQLVFQFGGQPRALPDQFGRAHSGLSVGMSVFAPVGASLARPDLP